MIEKMRTIGIEEVTERTGYVSDEIYIAIYEGDFPEQVSFGGNYFGWLESEVEEWIFVQILKASWGKKCAWNKKDYMRIRNNKSCFLDERLWPLSDVQSSCGTVCRNRIRKLYEYKD